MSEVAVPNFTLEISKRLDNLFTDLQTTKSITIPVTVRSLIEGVVSESLSLRKQEWSKRELDVDEVHGFDEAFFVIETSIRDLFFDIEIEKSEFGDSLNYVSMIGVIDQIQDKWCSIFPFCR